MKQRIITGVILGLLVLLGIFTLSRAWFETLALIVLLISAWEWTKFAAVESFIYKILYVLIAGCLMLVSIYYPTAAVIVSLVWWCVASFLVFRSRKVIQPLSAPFRYVMGWLVIIPLVSALSQLREITPMLLLFVLIVIVVGDSGAYFVGRSIGKRKLAPVISPKKTKEGLLGGVLLGGVSGGIFALFMHAESIEAYLFLFLSGFLIVLFALLGDLLESMIKRMVGIKDSGNILPGHGGILDRLDSVFAAVPLFVFLCTLFHVFPQLHF